MGYRYLEDIAIADAAFEVQADSIEDLFRQAADATMNVMVETLEDIRRDTVRRVQLEDDALDLLLFQFLNEFIYYKDAEGLLLLADEIRITEINGGYFLLADARGEAMDIGRHKLNVDVKAVTLHLFRVEKGTNGWEATVVLDI